MEPSAHTISAPSAVYEIGGRQFEIGSPGFGQAIVEAHAARQRPHCLCTRNADGHGVEMYIARLAGSSAGYIVKRMPDTGSHHATDCPSYEPPAELSGLGQVLGSAITEDPATGETTLKLDFPLTKIPGRSGLPPTGGDCDSVASSGTKLSLRGLLHYLWDQAELTRWHPGFAGKRTWATVRRHLLQAAEHKSVRGHALRARVYVPEPFCVEERDAINARRLAQWQRAVAVPGKPQHLMLLIGEVKEIVPARYGFKAVIKHVPNQAFAIDAQLYRRLGRRFETQLALWGSAQDVRMVMIATFGVSSTGIASIAELSLMPTTREWLPIDDVFHKQVVTALVNEGRMFIKSLRYNLAEAESVACAVLTDSVNGSIPLNVWMSDPDGFDRAESLGTHNAAWNWFAATEPMPALPPPSPRAASR